MYEQPKEGKGQTKRDEEANMNDPNRGFIRWTWFQESGPR